MDNFISGNATGAHTDSPLCDWLPVAFGQTPLRG
jgi:hypothetical protein